jgi:hypothetical protein
MKKLMAVFASLLLVGCMTGDINEEYVDADRQTFSAVAPKMRELLKDADETTRDDYDGLLVSWEARLKRAEEELAKAKAAKKGGGE